MNKTRYGSHRIYGTIAFFVHFPGNKLPGYDHVVPPGQRLSTPVHKFGARSLRWHGIEDEDDVLGNLNAIREFNEVYASHLNQVHHKIRDQPAGL